MPKVNILSPEVIAKIAAGEVVERPASVVKELVENSLDAGADSIEVHLKDAGKELIHIKDSGCGITKDDLEQIFQRHATSKIKNMDDLEKLSSMGFRGEALYSISAVSDIVLRTKIKSPVIPAKAGIQDLQTLDARLKHSGMTVETGWEIHLQAGKRLDLKPTAFSGTGTEIKITQLFFNTPARRKFLKSTTAEMQQILNIFLPYTLLYPSKNFILTHAGRSMLDLRSTPTAIDRMAQALNVESKNLMEASQDFVELGAKVHMILSNINIQRPRRDLQFIFVNNRPVENKNLSFNVNDIYRLILPPGVYPCFMLDIHIDPSEVDVNIHPTKREVRLRQEARLVSFVRHMTEYTLMQHGQARTLSSPDTDTTSLPNANTMSPPNAFPSFQGPPLGVVGGPGFPTSRSPIKTFGDDNIGEQPTIFLPGQSQTSFNPTTYNTPSNGGHQSSHWQTTDENLFKDNDTLQNKFARARFIGNFINKYLLFEADQSLFLVDQHAAQERIMFEKFQKQIEEGALQVQPLLVPIVLKLSPAEKIAWEEGQEKLKETGFETSLFDEDTLAIHTQPVLLKNAENVVRTLLGGDDVSRCDRLTIARRACKASVVTGDTLDATQANFQRQQLLACHDPFTCPHGRPTVVELKESFLDRQFLRT